MPSQAIHDPIETDDSWINGRSCEAISAEKSPVGENDDTDYDNRKIACGMVAQVLCRNKYWYLFRLSNVHSECHPFLKSNRVQQYSETAVLFLRTHEQ